MDDSKSCDLKVSKQEVIKMIYVNRASFLANISIVLTIILFLSSCSSQRVPEAMEVRPDKVPDFSITGVLYVKNTQSDSEQKDFGEIGVVQVKGNLKSWSDTAVKVLTGELKKRGAKIDEQASSGISLSVDQVVMGVSGLKFAGTPQGNVTISVTTNNGYNSTVTGEYTSLVAYKVGDGAITVAIEAMLNDPKIREFLTTIKNN